MAAMNGHLAQRPVSSAASDAGSSSTSTSSTDAASSCSSSSSSESSTGSSGSSTDGSIQHFNWATKGSCRQECVATLVQALMDDPVNQFLSGGHCAKYVRREVVGYLKALPEAANFIATPDHQAVALWQLLPQETPHNEFWAGWQRIFKVPVKLWASLLRMELEYEAQHERIERAYGPYYYLSYIGTRMESRGKGYASLLLKQVIARADSEGRHCMLEATSALSRALYEKHGFVLFQEYRPSSKAPPIFFMTRAPRPPAPPAVKAPPCAARVTSLDVALQEAGQAGGVAGAALSPEQQQLLRSLSVKSAAKMAAALGQEAVGPVGEDAIRAGWEVVGGTQAVDCVVQGL